MLERVPDPHEVVHASICQLPDKPRVYPRWYLRHGPRQATDEGNHWNRHRGRHDTSEFSHIIPQSNECHESAENVPYTVRHLLRPKAVEHHAKLFAPGGQDAAL